MQILLFVLWIMYISSANLISLWWLCFKLFDYWSIKRRIQFIRFTAHSFQNFSDNVTSVSVATFLTIITSMSDSVHYLFIIIHRAQLRIQSIIQIRNNTILVITRSTISMLIIDDRFACIRMRFEPDVSRWCVRLNWDVTASTADYRDNFGRDFLCCIPVRRPYTPSERRAGSRFSQGQF